MGISDSCAGLAATITSLLKGLVLE